MKTLIASLIGLTILLSGVSPVQAASYDGPETHKDITIDKRIGVPHDANGSLTYTYVDNVATGTHTYKGHEVVFFELRVRNTSNVDLINVIVTDFEPQYVELFENPGVLINDGTALRLEAGDFKPNQEKVFTIRGRVLHQDNIPTGVTCVINRARAEGEGTSDEDSAQFCIRKDTVSTPTPVRTVTKGGVTPTETIPSTGPAHTALIVSFACALACAGHRLKKVVS